MGQNHARATGWTIWPLACGLIWAGIANCSNESSRPNGGSGTCGELMSVYCDKVAACDPIGLRQQFGDVQGCRTRQNLACAGLSLPGTSWSAAQMQECAAQISSAPSCYTDYAESGACREMRGTLTGGTPCEQDSQCTSLRCNRASVRSPDGGLSEPACGVCWDTDAGSPRGCGDAGLCSLDQRCVFADDNQTFQCVSLQAEGAPCTATSPCAGPLFCKPSTADGGTAGVCMKPGAKGAACTASRECDIATGLRCVAGACNEPTFVAIGQGCDQVGRLCEKGARCVYSSSPSSTAPGTCQAPADDGSHCDLTANLHCRSPANCFEGICHLPGDAHCQ
jgi:hypothetical protein